MISATIQGKSVGDNHTTARDGKLITKEAQKRCIDDILNDCSEVDTRKTKFYKLSGGKFLCVLSHPEKDDAGRVRSALIVWDKDTDDMLIQKTLEVMGLEFERFLELKHKFETRQRVGVSKNTLVIVGSIALLAFAAYLLLKK